MLLIAVGKAGFTAIYVLVVLVTLGLILFSLISGIMLWQGSELGFRLAVILQAMQIPKFEFMNVFYSFYSIVSAGVELGWSASSTAIRPFVNVGAGLSVGYDWAVQSRHFGVNLLALAALIYLRKVKQSQKSEKSQEDGIRP